MSKSKQVEQVEQPRKYGQGALQAAFRQGFVELGSALKPLPDSLPIVEQPGQLNNIPIHGVSQQAGYSRPYQNPHIQEVEHAVQMHQPEQDMVTSHGVSQPQQLGIVDQHLEDLKAMSEQRQPEREISK